MERQSLKGYYNHLKNLDQKGSIIAEYIWIDGTGLDIRAKSKTITKPITSLADLPEWNYDGSSCYMASTHNSEVIMKPVAYFPDPFRGGDNIIVMTETFVWADENFTQLKPANTNFRYYANKIFEAGQHEEPWFGIEQEYTLLENMSKFTTRPLGWPSSGFPGPQGPYYCSVGANVCFGRAIQDAHYKACLFAGIRISGTNAEVMPGQWEFQVGPCKGVEIGDHLWVARYLLYRVAEDFGINVSFEPKLFRDWNGAGCHTNFSTKTMREVGGMEYIEELIKRLGTKHLEHIQVYGKNEKRLTGHHETSSVSTFSYGVGNRGSSVRIPTTTAAEKKGYIEDRRPASDIDPYVVGAFLVDTCILESSKIGDLKKHFQDWQEWIKTAVIEQP
jgi:glutamine synthetase